MQTITQHHRVFYEFVPFSGPAQKGYEVDFLGCKIRHAFWPTTMRTGIPQTSYPSLDEGYFEWIDLLESVVSAKRSYTMIELGAGFGRWLVRAAQAIRQHSGLAFHLIAVEAEPTHFEWIPLHFRDNDVDPADRVLIHAAVTDHADGDLIDFDIQGEELKVISCAIEEIPRKAKRLHIGTHSEEIEAGLRRVLRKYQWECLADYPCGSTNQTPWGPVKFQDAVQSWLNPRLV